MKTNTIIKSIAALAMAAGITACSSDYLSTEPITSVTGPEVGASTTAAQLAVRGICRMMYTQWQDDDFSSPRGSSGESTLLQAVNEALGPDNVSFFNAGEFGMNWSKWNTISDKKTAINGAAWAYCYVFISRANDILSTIADAEGDEKERQWIEAQARTFRAHGYIHALQWFGPRWQDSNNGEKMAVVLRLEPGSAPCPLASMKDVLDAIYKDLNTAIDLYGKSGMSREYEWEPDVRVAYGLYARAALLKNDWATAGAMAAKAREGINVMSNEEYAQGFINEGSDYLWTNPANDIYYSSWGSWFSCNGAYPLSWGRGFAINLDLYNELDPNDVRRNYYFTPDKVDVLKGMKDKDGNLVYPNIAKVKRSDFWSADYIDTNLDCFLLNSDEDAAPTNGMGEMAEAFVDFAAMNNPLAATSRIGALPYTMPGSGITSMQLGAQVKLWSTGYGTSEYCESRFPWMRATEMILIQAEAAAMQGQNTEAQNFLKEVNSVRIPGYTCTKTGQDLIDEVRLTRRIELWGEGHNWSDFKRWNLPCSKRAWVAGDVNSGNTIPRYATDQPVTAANGWRLAIPQSEEDLNSAFRRADLN